MGVPDLRIEASPACGSLTSSEDAPYVAINGSLAVRLPTGMQADSVVGPHSALWGLEDGDQQLWLSVTTFPVQVTKKHPDLASALRPMWTRQYPGSTVKGLGSDRSVHRLALVPTAHDPSNTLLSPVLYVYVVAPEGLVHAVGLHVSRSLVDENRMGCVAALLPMARSIALLAQPARDVLVEPTEIASVLGLVKLQMPGTYLFGQSLGRKPSIELVQVRSPAQYPSSRRLSISAGTYQSSVVAPLYQRKESPTPLLGGEGSCRRRLERTPFGELAAICRTQNQEPGYSLELSAPSERELQELIAIAGAMRIVPTPK